MKLLPIAFDQHNEPIAWLYENEPQRIDVDGQLIPLRVLRRRQMTPCAKQIKCFDNITRPCVRPEGHANGCNPFSDSDNAEPQTTAPVNDVGGAFLEVPSPSSPPITGLQSQREIQMRMDADCFTRAQQRGETTFTLVERDLSSPKTILFWIMENFDGKTPAPKLRDAFEDALFMLFSPIEKKRAD